MSKENWFKKITQFVFELLLLILFLIACYRILKLEVSSLFGPNHRIEQRKLIAKA